MNKGFIQCSLIPDKGYYIYAYFTFTHNCLLRDSYYQALEKVPRIKQQIREIWLLPSWVLNFNGGEK